MTELAQEGGPTTHPLTPGDKSQADLMEKFAKKYGNPGLWNIREKIEAANRATRSWQLSAGSDETAESPDP